MTLRDIGQFLLEFGKEFVEVFLWNTNWLDANILVLILVCIAYVLLTILAIHIWASISDEIGGLAGLVIQLLRWFFLFWIFSFIFLAPIWLMILLDIDLDEEPSIILVVVTNAWFAFVMYGFWWNDWGERIFVYVEAKLSGSKEIDTNSSD